MKQKIKENMCIIRTIEVGAKRNHLSFDFFFQKLEMLLDSKIV